MLEILSHLWPDFSALFLGRSTGLSALFWLVMAAIFSYAACFLVCSQYRVGQRLRALNSLLNGQTKEALASKRRETLQNALQSQPPEVGKLWREFDESLVSSGFGENGQLFNTLDAEHFFNPLTLARGLSASRLMAATPSFLVAIGVLGTFVGLTVGLESLDLDSRSEVDNLRDGIDGLIQGAAVAFMTSVWGVFMSLVLNFAEKLFERSALNGIRKLQQDIDYLYPRIPAEQSLVHIAEYGRESKEALQELHERIGDRLQETINGMSDAMQQALSDSLNKIMAPAIDALVNTTSQQSTHALERLATDFMDGMKAAGRDQGESMSRAADGVNAAVSSMTERMDQLFSRLSEQQTRQLDGSQDQNRRFDDQLERLSQSAEAREQQLGQRFADLMAQLSGQLNSQLTAANERDEERQSKTEAMLRGAHEHQREQLQAVEAQQNQMLSGIAEAVQASLQQQEQLSRQNQQLLTSLQSVTNAVATSSKHMEGSANQLGMLSANLRQATELLGQRMDALARQMESVGSQNAMVAEQLGAQATSLQQLQESLREAAQRLEQTAAQARDGFGEMKSHQESFLIGVKQEFIALGEVLRQQVEGVEKQAEGWLRNYSEQVSTQVSSRMNEWNESTLAFANQMQATVSAIQGIVDELEAR